MPPGRRAYAKWSFGPPAQRENVALVFLSILRSNLNLGGGRNALPKFGFENSKVDEALQAHTLVRQGLTNGGYRYALLSFCK
jgi:hypothetical protein